jgi:transcription factor TFIIIB component B''
VAQTPGPSDAVTEPSDQLANTGSLFGDISSSQTFDAPTATSTPATSQSGVEDYENLIERALAIPSAKAHGAQLLTRIHDVEPSTEISDAGPSRTSGTEPPARAPAFVQPTAPASASNSTVAAKRKRAPRASPIAGSKRRHLIGGSDEATRENRTSALPSVENTDDGVDLNTYVEATRGLTPVSSNRGSTTGDRSTTAGAIKTSTSTVSAISRVKGRAISKVSESPSLATQSKRKKKSRKTRTPGPRDETILEEMKRRKRVESPEDGEEREIEPDATLMSELCKDLKTGKKSSRFEEIRQLKFAEAKKLAVKRLLAQQSASRAGTPQELDADAAAQVLAMAEAHRETNEQRLERLGQEREAQIQGQISAPQMRLVNGQLVLDDASLTIDRHARQAIPEEELEAVEETDMTRRVNNATYSKRKHSGGWDEMSTDKFYEGLTMFGTDFQIISKMFSSRTRAMIKKKFNKEEKEHPARIHAALVGEKTVAMTIDTYQNLTQEEYADPKTFMDELEAEAERHRADMKEQEEADKGLREKDGDNSAANTAGVGSKENHGGEDFASTQRRKVLEKTKKRKKPLHSRHGGGDEVEIVGEID